MITGFDGSPYVSACRRTPLISICGSAASSITVAATEYCPNVATYKPSAAKISAPIVPPERMRMARDARLIFCLRGFEPRGSFGVPSIRFVWALLSVRSKSASCCVCCVDDIVIWLFSLPLEPSYGSRAKLALSFDKGFSIWTF